MKIKPRDVHPKTAWTLEQNNVHPLLARLYAARGLSSAVDIDKSLSQLLSPDLLLGAQQAGALLADAIVRQRRICIVADYDCDGATACAVAVRGLKLLGATSLQYVVPDRVVDGYGLTPPIAQRVHALGVDLLVTVDNGIASVDGVNESKKLGMQVLITDHHLPGPELPLADVIVNPNQAGCSFESKNLAGVGVMFYVLIATRTHLRNQNYFSTGHDPKLNSLLPLVALGTVADVVRLDANNRRLVANGLQMIRKGHSQPGIDALLRVASKDPQRVGSHDFGFSMPSIANVNRLKRICATRPCNWQTPCLTPKIARRLPSVFLIPVFMKALLALLLHDSKTSTIGLLLFLQAARNPQTTSPLLKARAEAFQGFICAMLWI